MDTVRFPKAKKKKKKKKAQRLNILFISSFRKIIWRQKIILEIRTGFTVALSMLRASQCLCRLCFSLHLPACMWLMKHNLWTCLRADIFQDLRRSPVNETLDIRWVHISLSLRILCIAGIDDIIPSTSLVLSVIRCFAVTRAYEVESPGLLLPLIPMDSTVFSAEATRTSPFSHSGSAHC